MGAPPIDRGWAWMCVFGAAVCNFFFTGSIRTMGIIMVEVMEKFHCSAAVTGMMLGMWAGVLGITSPIVTRLAVQYSYRKIIMTGGFIFGISFFCLSASPTVHVVVLSTGIFGGVGYCCIFGLPLIVVGQYFAKKRSFANGLTTAGGSLGQLTLPLLTRYLVDTLGFTGAFIVYGAFALNVIPAAALFRPFSFYTKQGRSGRFELSERKNGKSLNNEPKIVCNLEQDPYAEENGHQPNKNPQDHIPENQLLMTSKSEQSGLNNNGRTLHLYQSRITELKNSSSYSCLKHSTGSVNSLKQRSALYASTASLSVLEFQHVPNTWPEQQDFDPAGMNTDTPRGDVSQAAQTPTSSARDEALASFCCLCTSVPHHTKPWMEWSLFKNYMFIIYVFGMCLGNTGVVYGSTYLPPRAMDIGVDKQRAALLLSIVGATDFIGRIVGGWFGDLGYVKRYHIMTGTLVFTGLTALVCNQVESYASFAVLACVLGLIGGTYISLFVVVLVDFMGLEKLPSASGLAIMCLSLVNIPIPTLIGTIKDSTGSFQGAFVMLAVFMIAGGLCFALEPVGRKLEMRNKNKLELNIHNPIYKPCSTRKS